MKSFTITVSLIFFITITFIQGFIYGNPGGENHGCTCNPQPPCPPPPSCPPRQVQGCGSSPNPIQYVSRQPLPSYSQQSYSQQSYPQQVSSYASAPLTPRTSQSIPSSYSSSKQTSFKSYTSQPQIQAYDSQPLPSYSASSKSYLYPQSGYINSPSQQKYTPFDEEKSYSQNIPTPLPQIQPSQEYKYRLKKKFLAGAKIHDSNIKIKVNRTI
uniref:Uncharacterized protein n=1 Tax=Strongyloides venezuelensis TaxID=75913 RepID=A0A0K0FV66_STRVS